MNENINLCEILKGHEGETFYSCFMGNVTLINVDGTAIAVNPYGDSTRRFYYNFDGKHSKDGEQDLFPSKDQRDWIKWDKENNHKAPKTWSELIKDNENLLMGRPTSYHMYEETEFNYSIKKAASALIKILQLIENCYGGNVTNEEWSSNKKKYAINYANGDFVINTLITTRHHVTFYTWEQAEEFLSYPENVQLLKEYFMI